jgi:hypothetical protein
MAKNGVKAKNAQRMGSSLAIKHGSICVSGWWREMTVYDHSLLPAESDCVHQNRVLRSARLPGSLEDGGQKAHQPGIHIEPQAFAGHGGSRVIAGPILSLLASTPCKKSRIFSARTTRQVSQAVQGRRRACRGDVRNATVWTGGSWVTARPGSSSILCAPAGAPVRRRAAGTSVPV